MNPFSTSQSHYEINLQPVGRRVEVQAGVTVLEAARISGVELVSLCGGMGDCNGCKVRLEKGILSPLTLAEQAALSPQELAANYRLACQCSPMSNVTIDIPPESLTTPQRLQVEGIEIEILLKPAILPVEVRLDPPTLHDLRSDAARLYAAWEKEYGTFQPAPRLGLSALKSFSRQLREYNWHARLAVRGDEIVGLYAPAGSNGQPLPLLGLAVDIGTTKLAAYLLNLETGETIAKTGTMNPQIAYGEDVVSRISYAISHKNGAQTLQNRLADALNSLIEELCTQAREFGAYPTQRYRENIVEAVIVGNTAMHHIFAGLSVAQLGTAPYVPAVSEALDLPASEVGLKLAPGAYVHLPPNVAGYVGADHIAMLLATLFSSNLNPEAPPAVLSSGAVPGRTVLGALFPAAAPPDQRTMIALDIGTNTEISLLHQGRIVCCSCASGPAFEGAHIRDGMRAAPGAIERVQVTPNEIRIKTIGNQAPSGICGSGILDSVAEMLKIGILDERGALMEGHPAIIGDRRHREFVLSSGSDRKIAVTRQDVNEIQLAKGAIRTGLEILLKEAGLPSWQAVDDFIIAGAFGAYINIESAIRIGMFPALPAERFHQVGNAAGSGARQMLLSLTRRQMAAQIARNIEYIELSAHPDFTSLFSRSLFFHSTQSQ